MSEILEQQERDRQTVEILALNRETGLSTCQLSLDDRRRLLKAIAYRRGNLLMVGPGRWQWAYCAIRRAIRHGASVTHNGPGLSGVMVWWSWPLNNTRNQQWVDEQLHYHRSGRGALVLLPARESDVPVDWLNGFAKLRCEVNNDR